MFFFFYYFFLWNVKDDYKKKEIKHPTEMV